MAHYNEKIHKIMLRGRNIDGEVWLEWAFPEYWVWNRFYLTKAEWEKLKKDVDDDFCGCEKPAIREGYDKVYCIRCDKNMLYDEGDNV